MSMQVSLIITTYNRPDALAAVLESVRRQRRVPNETIVVDDGSDGRTAAVVRRFQAALPRLQHLWQKHDGFRPARMRNWGIAEASGDYVVFIDGDMVLTPRFIGDHVGRATPNRYLQGVRISLTEAATTAFLQRPFAIRPWHIGGLSKLKYLVRSELLARALTARPHGELTRIHSCNVSFWRDDLLEVNGFDERYNGFGGEDIDLCARMVEIGVLQQRLKFLALAYHLFHAPGANWSKLGPAPGTTAWAACGIDQHRPAVRMRVASRSRRAA
jgi:glycosyltransferase involved in cell wall biosynthesis